MEEKFARRVQGRGSVAELHALEGVQVEFGTCAF